MPIKNLSGTSLNTTTLGVTVTPVLWDAPDNLIVHGTNFANWSVDAGSAKDSVGVKIVQNSASDFATISISGLAASTTYWCKMVLDSKSGTITGNLRVQASGGNITSTSGGDLDIAIPPTAIGYPSYFQLKTDASAGPWTLKIVHNGGSNGDWFKFSAFHIFSVPFRSAAKVAVLGDREGGYTKSLADLTTNAIKSATADTVNVLAVGDQGGVDADYPTANLTLLADLRALGGNIYPMMGNHDYDGTRETDWFNYYDHIAAINGGKRYYKVTLGNMDIFTLDDNNQADNGGVAPADNSGGRGATDAATFAASVQGAWLQAALAASTAKWKVVMCHHPGYTSSSTGAFPSCRLPFAAWGAHLVIQSHDHGVERILADGIYRYTVAMGGGNHHGWAATSTAAPGTPQWRLDGNVNASFSTTYGYLKISDSTTDLILEYFDTNHQMYDRARMSRT